MTKPACFFHKAILPFVLALAALPASAAEVLWVDWISGQTDATGFTATGQIVIGSDVVTVTYHNDRGVSFLQDGETGNTTNYFSYDGASPYQSVGPDGVDNDPPPAEMVALIHSGTQSLSFSEPVERLYFVFVSLNHNAYSFDRDFTILSAAGSNYDGQGIDADGSWGNGPVERVARGDGAYSLHTIEGEPHGTLLFEGSIDRLIWNTDQDEDWHGITVGIQGPPKQLSRAAISEPVRFYADLAAADPGK